MNPLFQELSAVIILKLTLWMSLLRMQMQFKYSDIKIEYLIRTCSVATDLVTLLNTQFQSAVLLRCVVLAKYGTVLYSLISFISAALLQTVLQANTEPFGNALINLRNQSVETWNGLGESLASVKNVSKRSAVRPL